MVNLTLSDEEAVLIHALLEQHITDTIKRLPVGSYRDCWAIERCRVIQRRIDEEYSR